MADVLAAVAQSLLKREHPRLVAATGLIFRKLEGIASSCAISSVIESHHGGIWGDGGTIEAGYPILRSTNMRGARVDVADAAWCLVPPEQAERYALETGDILVTKSSGSSDLVGKSALFIHPGDGNTYLFSNFTLRLRPNQQIILPEFLAWFLRSPQSLIWRFENQQNAVGLRNLQTTEFLEQPIPVPVLLNFE
jgi:type I restriction enzyme S subunit